MTSIQMPQLGETIVEGTILKWLKQEGERIEIDEPLFELSTDKVDTEVPSPVSGTVTKILVPEGTTVAVGTALAEVDSGDGAASADGGASGSAAPDPSAAAQEPVAADAADAAGAPPPATTPAPTAPTAWRCLTGVPGRRSSRRSCGSWRRNTDWTCPRSRGAGPAGGSRRRT